MPRDQLLLVEKIVSILQVETTDNMLLIGGEGRAVVVSLVHDGADEDLSLIHI